MKPFALLYVLASLSYAGPQAQAAPLLICSTSDADWQIELKMLERYEGRLTATRKGSQHSCELAIEAFNYDREAIVPRLEVLFIRGKCNPELSANDAKTIMPRILLNVTKAGAPKPEARLQWNRYEQPSACSISRFNPNETMTWYERWKKQPR